MMHKNTMRWSGRLDWRHLAWLGVLVTVLLWGMMAETEARPRILRPGTRPGSFHTSIGPTIGVTGLGGVAGHLSNVIGYHFMGDSSGPALGGVLDLTFATGFVEFIIGGRFWWDIPVARMAIYIAPFIQPGFLVGTFGGGAILGFDLQFGVEGKVILNNRLLLTLRPISFDLQVLGGAAGRFGLVTASTVAFAIHFMHFGVGTTF